MLDQASAHATLFADGTAEVLSATHEIGNGAYTVFTQIAADALALPVEAVKFDLGDSTFPDSPITAGSRTTASVGAAVLDAGHKLMDALKDLGASRQRRAAVGCGGRGHRRRRWAAGAEVGPCGRGGPWRDPSPRGQGQA